MTTILCYGDSNTHGTTPMRHMDDVGRFPFAERWPGIMKAALGPGHEIIEAGLPGRTTVFDDPIEGAYRNGKRMLQGCLESHRPLDVVVLALGVNDLKARFSLSAYDIARGVGVLVQMINTVTGVTGKPAKVLVLSPPHILCTGWLAPMFAGGDAKSRALAPLVAAEAAYHGADCLDLAPAAKVSPVDGIHFDAAGQRAIGEAVAAKIKGRRA